MYGNSTKLGRGSGNRRSSFPPPSSQRPSAPAGGRMSLGNSGGGPRNRTNTANINNNSGAAAKSGIPPVEEKFGLVPGRDPPAFAMIIRLTPDLVDEISRVENDGGSAKIRFDSNANNTAGNVIAVGEKEFRFTWSNENSDLCDLYEERQSGVDGNGLLVESGCAWRKVNVQRILDESTTNHVKMRSEEADRKQKSRKAIILDPANPSMKNPMKALAAAETNTWRMPPKQQKKETTFKKRNVEQPQVSAPPKHGVYKSGSSTSASALKARQSASPLPSLPDQSTAPPSLPDQSTAPPSSFGIETFKKSHAIVEEIVQTPVITKEKISIYDKEIPNRIVSTTPASKGIEDAEPIGLQSILISLLKESPKGMSLKALEKAIRDTVPNYVKNVELEPIVKKIACFQASGRYILKPASELESFKKPSYGSGRSSPKENMHEKDNHDPCIASESTTGEKIFTNDYRNNGQLNKQMDEESVRFEDIGIQHSSPDLLGQKGISNIIEGHAKSSSDSGSGSDSSDSDSSDTGSPSRNKNKSPVHSGTGSSSDSESDASSNSKEGSDVDVDIMSSDNEIEQVQSHGLRLQDEMDERQDDHGFVGLEVETILPNNQEAEIALHPEESGKPGEFTQSLTSDPHVYQQRQNFIGSLFDEKENLARDGFRQEYSDSSERIPKRNKYKRASDLMKFDEKTGRSKRLKSGNLPQPPTSGSHGSYSNRPDDDQYKGSHVHMTGRGNIVGTAESDLQSGFDQEIRKKSVQDFHKQDQKILDHGGIEASGRWPKHSENSSHMHTSMSMQEDNAYKETQDEDAYTNHKKVPKNFKDGAFNGRHPSHSDSQYKKHDEFVENFQEIGDIPNLYVESLSKNTDVKCLGKAPMVNGRRKVLQRELSELELGELRENIPEGTMMVKEFERKGSFEQSASKVRVVDMTEGALAGKETVDPVKQSSPSIGAGFIYPESMSNKVTPEHYCEDKRRPRYRDTQSQLQHPLRAHQTEVGSHSTKLVDATKKRRKSESETGQVIVVQGNKETHKKTRLTESQPIDNKRERKSKKESKKQPSITFGGLANGQKKSSALPENNNFAQKKRESSSDENSCSYSKYEKELPELRGPIKDFSQYEEYVQEYRDKYDSYRSLDKILETDRNHFRNLGRSLETSKGREKDRYYSLLGELKDAYQQRGPRHKRLGNIFVVLHEELKALKQRIKDYALQYTKD